MVEASNTQCSLSSRVHWRNTIPPHDSALGHTVCTLSFPHNPFCNTCTRRFQLARGMFRPFQHIVLQRRFLPADRGGYVNGLGATMNTRMLFWTHFIQNDQKACAHAHFQNLTYDDSSQTPKPQERRNDLCRIIRREAVWS